MEKVRAALLLAALAVCAPLQAQDEKKPASIAELRAAIEEELREVGYGSAGVALVSREKTIWADGVGAADAESGRRPDANTYWRVGSISKSFVGLAALILEERGKLRLTDPVAALAPEVAIRNRRRDENPVRLAHLLEHTAGLDDLHFKDYAHNDPAPLSLRQGLEHIRDSLYCRWPPGLHSSYSNAGPAVAAYIVQKTDGRSYEQFVADEIIEPLQMTGAGLLLTDEIEAGPGARLRRRRQTGSLPAHRRAAFGRIERNPGANGQLRPHAAQPRRARRAAGWSRRKRSSAWNGRKRH